MSQFVRLTGPLEIQLAEHNCLQNPKQEFTFSFDASAPLDLAEKVEDFVMLKAHLEGEPPLYSGSDESTLTVRYVLTPAADALADVSAVQESPVLAPGVVLAAIAGAALKRRA